ncbi:MAG: hypothetical protein ACHQ4H_02160 [Ktedonobacterales bacterium]
MATKGSQGFWRFAAWFVLGLVLGAIPMTLLFLSVSYTPFCYHSLACDTAAQQLGTTLSSVGVPLYVAEIVIGIVLLFFKRTRPTGYGLLLMAAITPCVAVEGCQVRLPPPTG